MLAQGLQLLDVWPSSLSGNKKMLALVGLLSVTLTGPFAAYGAIKKKAAPAPQPSILEKLDYSKIAWPAPPEVARIKYTTYYSGEKVVSDTNANKKKQKWMDRVAGTKLETDQPKLRFALAEPYGMAVDSKGNLYVADTKVGAIFVFNTETKDLELIKNGGAAHFVRIIGLAMDDSDRLFVADADLHRVLVFDPKHQVESSITEGLVHPGGLAIDTKNRLLYVSDIELDQVLVYDADSHRLLRKLGTTGHKHELTDPGNFAMPSGMAVDRKGNLYVADTMNNRIEVFDPDGGFISTYGKAGDGPGYFARPKGVAVDSDGHIWVSDAVQDTVQVFDSKWRLLIAIGGHGHLPGQFASLCGITIDAQNRVFTSENYPGRVQQFLYIPDASAAEEKARRQAELDKKAAAGSKPQSPINKDGQKESVPQGTAKQ